MIDKIVSFISDPEASEFGFGGWWGFRQQQLRASRKDCLKFLEMQLYIRGLTAHPMKAMHTPSISAFR